MTSQDSKQGSLLGKTIQETSISDFEHIFYLFHLLSFSSGMDWRRMWEEFIYIKNKLFDSSEKYSKSLENIKNYIIDLQKQYR